LSCKLADSWHWQEPAGPASEAVGTAPDATAAAAATAAY